MLTLLGDGSVWRRAFGATDSARILAADKWDGFGGDCVHALQTHVISAMRDGTPLENEARDYLKVIGVKDAIYTSAETGCKLSLGGME